MVHGPIVNANDSNAESIVPLLISKTDLFIFPKYGDHEFFLRFFLVF